MQNRNAASATVAETPENPERRDMLPQGAEDPPGLFIFGGDSDGVTVDHKAVTPIGADASPGVMQPGESGQKPTFEGGAGGGRNAPRNAVSAVWSDDLEVPGGPAPLRDFLVGFGNHLICNSADHLERKRAKAAARVRKHYRKHRDRATARGALKYAVKVGRLVRMPCRACGNPKSEGHHPDYSKPLEVEWYCRQCHAKLHAATRPVFPRAPEAVTR